MPEQGHPSRELGDGITTRGWCLGVYRVRPQADISNCFALKRHRIRRRLTKYRVPPNPRRQWSSQACVLVRVVYSGSSICWPGAQHWLRSSISLLCCQGIFPSQLGWHSCSWRQTSKRSSVCFPEGKTQALTTVSSNNESGCSWPEVALAPGRLPTYSGHRNWSGTAVSTPNREAKRAYRRDDWCPGFRRIVYRTSSA